MKHALWCLLFMVSLGHATELKTYYYQWSGNEVTLRANGASQVINVGQSACTGSMVPRYFTPRNAFGVSVPVRIHGTAVCVWDSVAAKGAFYSLQRDKDWAFLAQTVLPNGQACEVKQMPGGYVRMLPDDMFLEENACAANASRSLGVVIYYTTE